VLLRSISLSLRERVGVRGFVAGAADPLFLILAQQREHKKTAVKIMFG